MNKILNTIVVFVMGICLGFSQANVPPNIEAIGDQYYCPLSQINIVTSFNIIDPDDTEIEALHIQISTGYVSGQDILMLTGTHPNVVATWNSNEGKLSLRGIGNAPVSYVDIIAAVNDVVFESSSANVSGEKFFSFTIGDANYLPSTGHFYEYVPNVGITWSNARTLAETYTYFGLQGYLATITSAEEAQLSGEQAAGAGWIGGSDEVTEGVWRWMTGPEAGTIFWNGAEGGSTPNFANWNTNEPNNLGNEDYAHVTAPGIGIDGSWNDLANTGDPDSSSDYHPQGFIVEYGGTPGDPVVDISASTKITINEIGSTTFGSSCGPGSISLEAIPDAGSVLWFDSATGGTSIGSGTTFTTPVISSTTTYYALASVNGCTEGIRVPVIASVIEIPSIISANYELICGPGIVTLDATASNGVINWYSSATGNTLVATGNSFTTPLLNTTTTYYLDATYNGCTSVTRTPIVVSVQYTPEPTGNTVQTFCDIDNATLSDLTITGTDVSWYDAATGGNLLNDSDGLTSSTYYATQTINGCEGPALAVDVIIYETVEALQPSEIPSLQACDSMLDGDDANGLTQFDLTQYETLLLNGSNASEFQVGYFTDASYTNQIMNPANYFNTVQDSQTIYVRMNNILDNSCFSDTSFNVEVNELPVIQPNVTFMNCDEDGIPDGFTEFNLSEVIDVITLGNSDGLDVGFYLSYSDADSDINEINPAPYNNMASNIVFARVENNNGCHQISTIDLQVSTTSFVSGYMQELEACDDDFDGLQVFDLTQASQLFINEFPTGQNLSVHYFESLNDAQLEQNEILSQTEYGNQTPFSQVLYVRVESDDNGNCFGIGPHLTLTVNAKPEFEIDDTSIYCLDGNPIILETYNPNGNYSYQWTNENGTVVSAASFATVEAGGIYTVIATSEFGCDSFPVTFNVVESAIADISMDDVTIVDFSESNTITINNSNNNLGIGDYEFALNDSDGPYQNEAFFNDIPAGVHDLYVRDRNGCGIAHLEVFVLGFPKFFTPNGDGLNDTWNLKGWSSQFTQQSRIYIYDRYGKLIKQLAPWSQGWNGTFNGNELRTTDFWFSAELIEVDGTARTLKGHFSLVR